MKKLLFLSVFFLAMSMVAFAQDNEQPGQTPLASKDLTSIQMGVQLAKYGYETKSAVLMTEAARILAQVQTQPMKDEPVERGDAVDLTNKKQATIEYDPMTLLADARKYAGDDPLLLELIDRQEKAINTQAAANRGRVSGPLYKVSTVAAHSYVNYLINFEGGKTAECLVVGDGDTDLDVYVYDEKDNLVGSSNSCNDECYVNWTPRWTGKFRIKVLNRGNVYNKYILVIK